MNTWHKKIYNVSCSLKKISCFFTPRYLSHPKLTKSHRNIYRLNSPINNRTAASAFDLCILSMRKLLGKIEGDHISLPKKSILLSLLWRNQYQKPVMSSDVFPCDETEGNILPPESVRGMTQLDRSVFKQTILVPALKVPRKHISQLSKCLKKSLAHIKKIKSIAELAESDPYHDECRLFLFDPAKYRSAACFSADERQLLHDAGVDVDKTLFWAEVELNYDNWSAAEILRAILPQNCDNVSGFSNVGHIAHLNLRDETLPFKFLIGQVILDKVSSVRTVVNKMNIIDNTFRNFQMELLAGEDDFYATVRENKCVYQFDFSKVYWNSRLAMEHERIVSNLERGDVVYDVFAGVGPFAIPASKKGCIVLANDLNPESYKSLVHNAALNRIKSDFCAYNMDGRKFIRNSVKEDMSCRWLQMIDTAAVTPHCYGEGSSYCYNNDSKSAIDGNILSSNAVGSGETCTVSHSSSGGGSDGLNNNPVTVKREWTSPNFHIVMNLPAIAVEFLDVFRSMCFDVPVTEPLATLLDQGLAPLPHVYCYCFYKGDKPDEDIREKVRMALGCEQAPQDLVVRFVRNVAPNKDMYCVEFVVTKALLWSPIPLSTVKVENHGNAFHLDSLPDCRKRRLESTEFESHHLQHHNSKLPK
ncbi:tRNA (guanine(37)-N1)-methyltransferase-like [Argonauta hians]